MNAASIFREYANIQLCFPDLYKNIFSLRDYFETIAAEGKFDEFEEITAWIQAAEKKFPEYNEENIAISAFVSFFWHIEECSEEVNDDTNTIIKYNGNVLFNGKWKQCLNKWQC